MPVDQETLNEEAAVQRSFLDARVFVVGGGFQYIQMFHEAGFRGARTVEDADIVCFTGGEDVSPSFYGEEAIPGVYSNVKRDEYEAGVYGEALALKKAMVGICRGSQFLNVMNGGKLWQDVNNHGRGHAVTDIKTGEIIQGMTSTHHQQMRPAEDAEIIAVAELSTTKKAEGDTVVRGKPELDDMEVLWYPSSQSLCFQPHPEFMKGSCRNYFLSVLDEYVLSAC